MGENGIITLSPLFFIGSFSYLKEMMTHNRAWMSRKSDQIRPRTKELAALELLKISLAIDPINFKFVVNKDMHDI